MTSRRFSFAVFVAILVFASCGGSDDPSSDTASSTPGDVGSDAEPDSSVSDPAESESSNEGDTGASEVAPLSAAWSAPVNGSALGSTIAISPDGSQVAFMTGGLEPMIQIHDGSTGEIVNSAPYHGQGVEMVWTADNQLVSWDSKRLHLVDVATLTYPGGVDLTIAPGAEECPTSVFSVDFDRASNAMFISDFHDTGTIVCRLDIASATITSTIVEGQGGLNDAFLRPETGELVVAYSMESISATDSVAVLDAATLEVKSSGPTPTGEPVKAATATDLVVGIDRATDGLASTGQPIAALANGERFGPYLFGTSDLLTLVVMDATTGAALLSGSDAFLPMDGTDDGTRIVVLRNNSLELFELD